MRIRGVSAICPVTLLTYANCAPGISWLRVGTSPPRATKKSRQVARTSPACDRAIQRTRLFVPLSRPPCDGGGGIWRDSHHSQVAHDLVRRRPAMSAAFKVYPVSVNEAAPRVLVADDQADVLEA